MAVDLENPKNSELVWRSFPGKAKVIEWLLVLLRLGALMGMSAAAFLMANNKQTKSMAVAVVGTTPIYQTLTAEFRQMPAFVYFVIANAIGGAHNLSVLLMTSCVKRKGFRILVHLVDLVILAIVATGVVATAFIADLGKNGNPHARWFPICDKFDAFCSRGGTSLMLSFIGTAVFMLLKMINLHKHATTHYSM